MAGEGTPYRADTGGGVGATPDLRAPLGAPNILRPEDFIAMANFNDPTVALTNAAKLTSSLIDNHYDNQIKLAKAQADLQYSAARTRSLDADTDIVQRTADDKVAQMAIQTDLQRQDYENRKKLNPIAQQAAQNRLDADSILLDQAKRNAQDQNEAIAQIPDATSELPDPNDPNYAEKRDQWRIKYNRLLTNPATKTRMEGEYQAVDGVYQNLITTQEANATRKEIVDLQTRGHIPSPINPDALIKSPDLPTVMARGRMSDARHSIEEIAAQLPANSPQRAQLQTMLDEAEKDIGSDTGTQDVMAAKSKIFDTNGRLTGNAQGALQQAQNVLTAQQKAEIVKPQTEVEVPFGKPNVKGEYPGKMIIKGVEPSIGEQWAQKYGLTPPAAQQPAGGPNLIQDPAVRDLAGRYQRREITRDQFIEELKKLPTPAAPSANAVPQPNVSGPAAAPTPPVEGTSSAAPSSTETANPDGSNLPPRVQAVGDNDPAAFIVHHTSGRGTVDGVVSTLKERGLGVEYVMDRNGNIFHTGEPGSANILPGWGKGAGLNNKNVVGMEIIANDDKDVTPEQAQAFARFIAARYPNTPLFGHGEVNPGHKEADEGQTAKNAALAYRAAGAQAAPVASADRLEPHLGGHLTGHGQDFVDAGKQYNLNPGLLASIAIEESGNGTNEATIARNNPMSMGGGSARYDSIRDGIFAAAQDLRENYVDQGLKDVASIGRKYAPPGASNDVRNTNRLWPGDVTAIYNRIAAKTQSSSAQATPPMPERAAIRPVSYQPGVESSGENPMYGEQTQNAPRPRLVTTNPATVDFGDYTFNVAGTFGRHYDGTVDTSESGKGFYSNPATGKPYDLRDSKLVGARIPISDLEQVMGLDANDRNSPISKDIATGEYQVQVATPDGTVVQMPLVDVNTDPNARGLELTYAASRLFQSRGARQLGYKIVARTGETVTPTYGVKPGQIRGRQTFQSEV